MARRDGPVLRRLHECVAQATPPGGRVDRQEPDVRAVVALDGGDDTGGRVAEDRPPGWSAAKSAPSSSAADGGSASDRSHSAAMPSSSDGPSCARWSRWRAGGCGSRAREHGTRLGRPARFSRAGRDAAPPAPACGRTYRQPRWRMTFDMAGTFGDDYLYFYEESIDDVHSDADTAEILGLLDLPAGRASSTRRVATAGSPGGWPRPAWTSPASTSPRPTWTQARADPQPPAHAVTYLEGDLRDLPVDGPFDAVVCWLNSFGYYDDADCHRVLEEFHRVLRPGGKVAIDTMHHDGGVRHFTPAPDAVVVQHGDDTMVEVSTFDPVPGRMVIERTVHRAGRRPPCLLLRAAPDAARSGWSGSSRPASTTSRSAPGAAGRSSSTAGRWSWSRPPEEPLDARAISSYPAPKEDTPRSPRRRHASPFRNLTLAASCILGCVLATAVGVAQGAPITVPPTVNATIWTSVTVPSASPTAPNLLQRSPAPARPSAWPSGSRPLAPAAH